jgi:hypothetical protein
VSAVTPRTGDVLGRGEDAVSLHLSATWALGRIEQHRPNEPVERWNSGPLVERSFWWFSPLLAEVSLGLGLGHGCEGSLLLGLARLGGEVRCAAADEDEGHPVSLAFAVGGGYQPARSFWARAGFDLSRRADGGTTPFADVYVSLQRQDHRDPADRFFGGLWQRELRLTAALGAQVVPGDGQTGMVLAAAPFVPLWAGPARFCGFTLSGPPCWTSDSRRFRQPFGVDVTGGLTLR